MKCAIMIRTTRGYENINMPEKLAGCAFSKIFIGGPVPVWLKNEIQMRAEINNAEIIYLS